MTPSGPSRALRWSAHATTLLAALLLAGAAFGWIAGGAEVVARRTGLPVEDEAARALAAFAGLAKGLLDLWPLPLAAWFAWRRDPGAAAAVWAVATLVIPVADLISVAQGRLAGGFGVHLLTLALLGGAAFSQALLARRTAARPR